MDLPLGLLSAIETGRCVLFIGSGVGFDAVRPNGTHLPVGEGLAEELSSHFRIDAGDHPDLGQIAQLIELRKGRPELIAALQRLVGNAEPDEHLKWLFSRPWKAVFTTNYDGVIERSYELTQTPVQSPVVISTNSELTSYDPRYEIPIYHLHGSVSTKAGRGAVLITQRDYATYLERRSMLFNVFATDYATTPILYIGYSHADPNWRMVTTEVRRQFGTSEPPISYRLTPDTSPIDREILQADGIVTIDGNLADLQREVITQLGSVAPNPHPEVPDRIPVDLREVFVEQPAPLDRLLNRWVYVNAETYADSPNVADFLKGTPPNWSLVGQGLSFQRDLEERLVDQILNFATAEDPGTQTQLVLAPAGYGMTTFLMAVTAWFARNRAGTVLFSKRGAEVVAGDIEFALSSLPPPLIFIVDNAADCIPPLEAAIQRSRELKADAFFLMGERLNEWRQARPRMRPPEYALEPLSDEEIDRLLEMLASSNMLGNLEGLSHELQIAAIKIKNQQELLVTMREVTDGRAFDAIIEDEYRNIASDGARELYGLVCALGRLRVGVRDQVAAETLGLNIADIYTDAMTGTEGLVRFEEVDASRGIEAIYPRHPIIAEIVWSRCLDSHSSERLLLSALSAFNLNYSVDAKLFEAMTRDDRTVDAIPSFEGRMSFYETAARKDPTNAYVRQHYARMLRREGRFKAALAQIDKAIEMSPRSRVLWHTKGTLLRDLALEERTTPELGRRRVAQSEAAFRAALNLNPRDEYSHQGLAELYLRWAKARAATDPNEAASYIRMCEEVIRSGLAVARDRESLYIVSSDLIAFLGDAPGQIAALRRAADDAPDSTVSTYLLGMALRRHGSSAEALEVLERGLTAHPDDHKLARAAALVARDCGRSWSQALALLRLGSVSGSNDAEYVATLGGILTMAGDLTEAQSVWDRSARQSWDVATRNRIIFRPDEFLDPPLWVEGRVGAVKSGYAFIQGPGLPDFFLHSSRSGGTILRSGLGIDFRPGFGVRGPVAWMVRPQSEPREVVSAE